MKLSVVCLASFLLFCGFLQDGQAAVHRQRFVLTDSSHRRLCNNKTILTVNGQFPGPTLYATEGDTIIVDVINRASENVTIHWHGVKQPRYPWSDGPVYITQCPIQPGGRFSQRIVLSDEIGTLWWHAHSDWSRATVHGALIVRPKPDVGYPFPKPAGEIPIILGEWWNRDIKTIVEESLARGGEAQVSDAFLINGQPGDNYPCSRQDTFKLKVEPGKTYLLRMINAVMNNIMYLRISNHTATVVGSDGAYLKPFATDVIAIAPGQTMDVLLEANQPHSHYYMSARIHAVAGNASNNATVTAIVEYTGNYTAPSTPFTTTLPAVADTAPSNSFTRRLRSLASNEHPLNVPMNVDTKLFFTLSVNTFPCPENVTCDGPLNGRLRASINNITFVQPDISILQAYYNTISGVYGSDFPSQPPIAFNYTAATVPQAFWVPQNGTDVRVIEYDSQVELVFQGTGILGGVHHPMHLHGYSYYVVGWGLGNFNQDTDPANYNLVDPPHQNTIVVPQNGWVAIRFRANNPGVWLLHCHFERHTSWGMEMAFIVKNGKGNDSSILPPPSDMPRC